MSLANKPALLASLLMTCIVGCSSAAVAQRTRVTVRSRTTTTANNAWVGGAPLQTRVVVGADGETYVAVWVDAPDAPNANIRERAPMSVSLVVDTSGSMSGEKIVQARLAAASLLETLQDGDIVSIIGFSNQVVALAQPTVVGPSTRAQLMRQANSLYAAGGTNMYGGVQAGIAMAGRAAPSTHAVRRVFLISDGHANIGPSDANSLGILAGNGTEENVQVTGIGVGLDYDENTLGALAVRSSGRLYHLEHPAQMASILEREVQLLGRTVATSAFIEVIPAPGVRILEGVSVGSQVQDGKLLVPIGSVYAGQRREVLFRAAIDTSRPGEHDLARAQLRFQAPGEDDEQTMVMPISYEVTRSVADARASTMPRVQTIVANVQASQAQRAAAVALNEGNIAEAERHYEFAASSLAGALDNAPAAERAQVQERIQRVRSQQSRASGASAPAAARSLALESYDAAMEADGY